MAWINGNSKVRAAAYFLGLIYRALFLAIEALAYAPVTAAN